MSHCDDGNKVCCARIDTGSRINSLLCSVNHWNKGKWSICSGKYKLDQLSHAVSRIICFYFRSLALASTRILRWWPCVDRPMMTNHLSHGTLLTLLTRPHMKVIQILLTLSQSLLTGRQICWLWKDAVTAMFYITCSRCKCLRLNLLFTNSRKSSIWCLNFEYFNRCFWVY